MNSTSAPAMLRSLIVYAICVPLAIVMGYSITSISNSNLTDYQSLTLVALLAGVLIFPLLMKWHYPLLIFSVACPITVFFIPGHPAFFLAMVATSLTISVVERILNKERHFVPWGGVQWPLLAMLAVIVLTAKLTGGFGLRSMGSDVYGGKKYVFLIVGILSFFAVTARPIPKNHVNLYILLYFVGGFFAFISDFSSLVPAPLRFIYLVFPMSDTGMDEMGNTSLQLGVTRLGGVAGTASAIFYWLVARYGIRELLLTGKFWRPLLFGISFALIFLGGFRSAILLALMTIGVLFYLEKLHRTGIMLAVLMAGMLGGALLVPMASHLPYTFQRALAFLPLNINSEARLDAEGSSQWRINMWEALLPQVPKYLLLGKGFSFSSELFDQSIARDSAMRQTIDASQDPLALSSDFHNGPLSLVIPFGIWGVLTWLWMWVAGFRVLWRNYRYGDPQHRHINLFLLASFIAKCAMFAFIAGGITVDIGGFAMLIGLSLAMNNGVMGPNSQPKVVPADAKLALELPVRPAFQR